MKDSLHTAIIIITVILLITGAAGATVNLGFAPSSESPARSLDSQQPDTMRYDMGGYYYMFGPTNLWGAVRFTTPASFELRCLYLQMYNPNSVTDGVTVYVKADDGGQPGTTLAGPITIDGPLWLGGNWLDVEMESPYLNFAPGEDFYVLCGSAPGGNPEDGWFLYIDNNGNTDDRSAYATNPDGPWNSGLSGDLIMRAGGILADFVDLAAVSCFTESGRFFIPEDSDANLRARIRNEGSMPVYSYDVTWTVTNEVNQIVFEADDTFGPMALGAETTVSCPQVWQPESRGFFTVEAVVTAANDANADNNTASLEQGVSLSGESWYSFDDGEWDANVTLPAGMGWGQRFNPAAELVQIDSVQVAVAGDLFISDVRLVQFNSIVAQEMWSYSGPLSQGVNTIDLTGATVQIGGDGVGLGYFFQDGGPIYRDSDAPLAGSNPYMEAVSYQLAGAAWTVVEDGDWGLRIFCTDIIPVEPEVSLDLIDGFKLLGSYPNPFNQTTAIRFQQSAFSQVSWQVYDAAGRLVASIDEGWLRPGIHRVIFDAGDLVSGVYLYQLHAGEAAATGRMVLLK
ncbi:MAG: T9SS type A sorting domain-containing protein [bacterium]